MFDTNSYISYAVIAVGIFTFYMAVVNLLRSNRSTSHVRQVVEAAAHEELQEEEDEEDSRSQALAEFCKRVLRQIQGKSVVRPAVEKELSKRLALAGINSPDAMIYFVFVTKIIQPILLVIGLYVSYGAVTTASGAVDVLTQLGIGGIFLLLGWKGASLYVANIRQKRVRTLIDSFPEVMDLLLVCIESGLGLDAALNRVCKELRHLHPVVISELDRTRMELTMLGDRVTALQNLADRINIISYNTLVSSLIQTEKFGTSLVDTLRVLSEEQRVVRLYDAEQKAARVPVLVTVPLILFIMPAFVLVILGPPMVRYLEQGVGQR